MEGPWLRRRSSLNCWIDSAAVSVVIVSFPFFTLSSPVYFIRLDNVVFKPLSQGGKGGKGEY